MGKEYFLLATKVANGLHRVHIGHRANSAHTETEPVIGAGHRVDDALQAIPVYENARDPHKAGHGRVARMRSYFNAGFFGNGHDAL